MTDRIKQWARRIEKQQSDGALEDVVHRIPMGPASIAIGVRLVQKLDGCARGVQADEGARPCDAALQV